MCGGVRGLAGGAGFSAVTIENATGVLERFLAACGRPAWEVAADDIDRVVGELAAAGMTTSTRRGYVQGFHGFLVTRRAAQIEAAFGVRLEDPIDAFNASRHVGNDSPATRPPPSEARMERFFAFLRERVATARKYGSAGRDYALFRTLYHAGLRADEAASLDVGDLHFGRGPFGKLHVRFGKGAKASGPRPRWVPMLDGLDLILRWFVDDVRSRFPPARRCSVTRAAVGCIAARSATGCATCSTWKAWSGRRGSASMIFGMPARPATMNAAWIWSRSNRCSATGTWAPRCGM